MKLSLIIPAHNESECLEQTVRALFESLVAEKIDHELLIIDDHSSDATSVVLQSLQTEIPTLRWLKNTGAPGFGAAVQRGLENYHGDAAAIVMADGSDSPQDLVRFFRVMTEQNVECVFGSRFIDGGCVVDYPRFKLVLNRLANTGIRILFGLDYDDVTNAFKLYRREVTEGLRPFLSRHFNMTVELPLKAIVRGYSYAVVPNSWTNRKTGVSKLKIQEMGSRYLFIVLYCFIERWLSKGDYHRRNRQTEALSSTPKALEQPES